MDLFETWQDNKQKLAFSAWLFQGFVLSDIEPLLADLKRIISAAPLRHMLTPGGFTMSVAMTNCGDLGWVTDRTGYRYTRHDPLTGERWPAMPTSFLTLAGQAASEAGFADFTPDACLINQYKVGARMSLHQDKNEQDFSQPIVSVSLGLPAVFQFGGFMRTDKPVKILLTHGDVMVWGDESRLRYHGVFPLKAGNHVLLGGYRINLTFRKAG
ncbi:MAG: DNA oxidative demethylase AlkB [Methylophilaceae bacterium]